MNRNIIIAILGVCAAIGIALGLYNLPENPEVIVPPEPIINETEVINGTDIVIIDNNETEVVVVDNETEGEFIHNFSKFTLLK
jgi:hypothetical protein